MRGDREKILAALSGGRWDKGTQGPRERGSTGRQRGDSGLWQEFESRLPGLGARIATLDEIRELSGRKAWVDEDARTLVSGFEDAEEVWEAEVGVTLAECAVAESGSVLVVNDPGRRRLTSLAPEIHVALVREADIVACMEEAFARVPPDRSAAFITGSSRTADIEGVLVRGVHGPREVWIVRI